MRNFLLRAGPAAVPLTLIVLLSVTARRSLGPAPSAVPAPSRYAALAAEAKLRTRAIPVSELKVRLDVAQPGLLLVDVREDSEWEQGRLPGAVHMSRGILESKIEKAAPDPKTPIVLYCASGARSALAAESLRRMGYLDVVSLDGGFKAWTEAGGATVKK
jgi:rhodanese-related sulfurtransferase